MEWIRVPQTVRRVFHPEPYRRWQRRIARLGRRRSTLRFPRNADPYLHGRLETVHVTRNTVRITGWVFHEKRKVLTVSLTLVSPAGEVNRPGHYGLERPDVVRWLANDAGRFSGFWVCGYHELRGPVACVLNIWYADAGVQRIVLGTLRIPHGGLNRSELHLYGQYVRTLMRYGRPFGHAHVARCLEEVRNPRAFLPQISLSHVLDRVLPEPAPLPERTEPVDIIIPVYNALDHLKRLMRSLLAHTRAPYRLILIDDCSTDPAVWPYLQSVARQQPGTVLLRNETNRGFPATVNRGIRASRHHFVILNTDIEVPPGWLERLMAPIMVRPHQIATTTPFTNGSTLFGFPRFMIASAWDAFFDGMSVSTVDRFFRTIRDDGWTTPVPSGFGLCMGVNRHVVREIGLLDETTFGRGYGEDADWCMRARYRGYRHVLVPNLLVYHRCGASFDAREKEKWAGNWNILVRKHPLFPELVERFVAVDPAGPLRDFLFMWTVCTRGALFVMNTRTEETHAREHTVLKDLDPDRRPVVMYNVDPRADTGTLLCTYRGHTVMFPACSVRDVIRVVQCIPIEDVICRGTAVPGRTAAVSHLMDVLTRKTEPRSATPNDPSLTTRRTGFEGA